MRLALFLPTALAACISSTFVDASEIERVVVTSQRAQSDWFTTDRALSQVGSEEVKQIGAIHINEALGRVPGTWISRGNGQEHLTAIRSPVLTGAGGCGAFFMAEDGISLRAPGFCNANQLFGVNSEQAQSIEVLRGPSSVLYGSNAVHGVINVITPDVDSLADVGVGFEVGPHGYRRGRLQAKYQEGAHGFAAYGNATTDGGFKEESGFDQQKLNLLHQYQSDQIQIKSVLAFTNLNQETAGFIRGFEAYRDPELRRSNPNPEAFRDSLSLRGYSRISLNLENGGTFTVTPYFRYHDMQFLQHFLPWQPTEDNAHRSLGLQSQYQFAGSGYEVTTGFDTEFTDGELQEVQDQPFAPNLPQGSHYDYQVDAFVWSPFIDARLALGAKTWLRGGLRYEATQYDYDNRLSDGSACAPEVNNCRFFRPSDQRVSYHRFSPRLGISSEIADGYFLFAQLSQGYRAPQATELFRLQAGQTTADLDAERANAAELGLRAAGQEWFYEVNAFAMDKKHFIFQDTERQNVSNGETEHYGLELSGRYQWRSQWYVAGQLTLARHKYANDIAISRGGSIEGNDIDTAPKVLSNLRLGWQALEDWQVELEWQHLGKHYLDSANTAEYDGHDLFNLRVSSALGADTQLTARWLNITDEEYAERADFAFGSYRYFVGESRALYVGVTHNW